MKYNLQKKLKIQLTKYFHEEKKNKEKHGKTR